MNLEERRRLGRELRRSRDEVAAAVTDEFLQRHPGWKTRYGERAITHGRTDACFHLDFLASAVDAGADGVFTAYARWTAGVLESRNIERRYLAENLQQIGRALRDHLPEAYSREVERLIRAGVEAVEEEPAEAPKAHDAPLEESKLYFQALLQGNRKAALGVARETLRSGTAPRRVYSEVVGWAQREMGLRWASGEISVAQEHIGTAISQYVVARLFSEIDPGVYERGRAVVTGVEGELHQLGGHMVADMWTADGWDVRFLGTDLPRSGILQVVSEEAPDIVGVSCTLSANLPALIDLVQALLEARNGQGPAIVIGGQALAHAPELWREIGADGQGSSLEEAVELARSFSTSPS